MTPSISIESIEVPDGRRPLRDVMPLANSINELGLINPITVREEGNGYVLVSGGHRLQACKDLGWDDIPARVVDLDELRTELVELDENLIRNELSALERSEALARRKAIYEQLYPTTGHGKAPVGRGGRKEDAPVASSFVEDTAEKTGRSSRVISQDVQIANNLPGEIRDTLRGTPAADRKMDLLGLSQVEDPEEQKEIAEQMARGERFEKVKALLSSESNEWFTPDHILDIARQTMGGIDLDPASCETANERVGAATYFSLEDDGLEQEWHGRVWMNPPYGKTGNESNAAIWIRKLIEEIEAGHVEEAMILVNASPSTTWFKELWEHGLVCFLYDRVAFIEGESGEVQKNPTHSNALVYFGPNEFAEAVGDLGQVVIAWEKAYPTETP